MNLFFYKKSWLSHLHKKLKFLIIFFIEWDPFPESLSQHFLDKQCHCLEPRVRSIIFALFLLFFLLHHIESILRT